MQETWLGSWVRKIRWRKDKLPTPVFLGFPGGSAGKESACNAGELGSIPRVGKIPWRREWLPTPVFWSGQFHGLHSPWSHKCWKWLRDFHFQEEKWPYVDSKEADIYKPGRDLSQRAESAWPLILPLPGLEMPLKKL